MSGKNIPRYVSFNGVVYEYAAGLGQSHLAGAGKVGVLGQEPEPIKMVLDLDVNEALDKISSVIARTELADNLKSPVVINATNLTVNGVDIAADIKRIVIEQLKKELQPGGILNQ